MALLGPHQAGKTVKALAVGEKLGALDLDLESEQDRARLDPPEFYLADHAECLVKSPKVFVRDSGLVHALLGVADKEALSAHPVLGQSWEGFVVENLLACAPHGVDGYFYRSSGGAEIDLLLARPDGGLWAVEIKRSLAPKLQRGFHSACADLRPVRKFVVYPGAERHRLAEDIEAIPLAELAAMLRG